MTKIELIQYHLRIEYPRSGIISYKAGDEEKRFSGNKIQLGEQYESKIKRGDG
jgi:hypothetical protein